MTSTMIDTEDKKARKNFEMVLLSREADRLKSFHPSEASQQRCNYNPEIRDERVFTSLNAPRSEDRDLDFCIFPGA